MCIVAGDRSAEDGRELLCAGNGDDGVVNRGADAAAAVGCEDRSVGDVVGWACEDGAERADLARVSTQCAMYVCGMQPGLTVTGPSSFD